jgi:hypothetical protein
VLTLLIGILGTILGFYFGSADRTGAALDVGELQFTAQQLYTRVSGGTRPYRYSITSSDNSFPAQQGTSEDGWIIQPLQQRLKEGSTITIDVTDSKDVRATKKRSVAQDSVQRPGTGTALAGASQPSSSPAPGSPPAASEPPRR